MCIRDSDLGEALFEHQIASTDIADGGDSGGFVLTEDDGSNDDYEDNQVIGELFAGSPANTIINPIDAIIEALDLDEF